MNDIKKILMTTDPIGGIWTYTLELCRFFQEMDIEVIVFSSGKKLDVYQKKEMEKYHNIQVINTPFKLEWMEDCEKDIEDSVEILLEIENEFHPDIIHLNSYSFGSAPFLSPKIVVAHSCVFSWFKEVYKKDPSSEWANYYKNVKDGLSKADYVIAPSETMMIYLNENYGAFRKQKVIYNGRTPDLFKSGTKQPFVISVGRLWDEGKNISAIAEAAQKINWVVAIAGDNVHPNTREVGTFKNVKFLGKLYERGIADILTASSIFVHPAKYEPFGLSVLEAALSKNALVLSNIESMKEIWKDNAIYVDPNDVDAIAEVVNRLIDDVKLREEYTQRAFEHAKLYSADICAANYLEVYNECYRIKRNQSIARRDFLD